MVVHKIIRHVAIEEVDKIEVDTGITGAEVRVPP